MPLTVVSQLARYGPRLGPYAGLADIPEALRYALTELGRPPASPSTVVDADLLPVVVTESNQLDDLVMYRCYETILLNLTADLLREAGIVEKAAELRAVFQRLLERQAAKLKDQYGVGLPTPTIGVVALDFQQRGDDALPTFP